ncbi:elongation factor P [Streptomyces sp. NPDC056463]|uniref:elongation factor P n=1 Tax=Streptomyces sp. NPDC056463 TaxID=3345827 RepID=UPI0036830EAB
MANAHDIRDGMILKLDDGNIGRVVSSETVKPSGGGPAFVRAKVQESRTGKTVDKSYTADAKVDTPDVEHRDMQFIYKEGDSVVFLDTATYDQITAGPQAVGEGANFLVENLPVTLVLHGGEVHWVDVPPHVEVTVEHADSGNGSGGRTKRARLETGYELAVPLSVNTGDKIKVSTRKGTIL